MPELLSQSPLIRNPAFLLEAGWRQLFLAFLVFVVTAVLCGYWYYLVTLDDMRADEYEDLSSVAAGKVDQIVQWRRERLADVRVLAESPFSRQALMAPTESGDDWMKHLELTRDAYRYAEVLVADASGKVFEGPVPGETVEAIASAIENGGPVLSDLHRGLGDEEHIYIDAVAPVVHQGQVLGVVVLRVDADEFLLPLMAFPAIPGTSTEILFFARRGEEVVFLSNVRFDEGAAMSLSFPLSRTELPAVQAVLGTRGMFEGVDYRGIDVLADLNWVPNSGWYVLAKTDLGEMRRKAALQAGLVTGLITLVVLAAITTVAAFYRRHQARLYLQLYRSEQEKKEREDLLRIAGRVARMGGWSVDLANTEEVTWSPEMFELYEYPEDEIPPGKTTVRFETAMSFLTPESADRAGAAFEACASEGTPYDIEVSMTTFRGRPVWMRGIAEPVRDEQGNIVGVSGAFQEITAQKEATRELYEATMLLEKTLDSLGEAVLVVDPDGRRIVRCNHAVERIFGYQVDELIDRPTEILHVDRESFETFGRISEAVLEKEGTFFTEFRMKRKDGTLIDTENRVTMLYDDEGWTRGVVSVVRDITEKKRAENEQAQLQMQLLQSQKMQAIGRLAGGLAHDFNNMLNVILGYTEMILQNVDSEDPIRGDLLEVRSAAERSADLTRQLLAFARQQTIAPETVDLNDTISSMLSMLGRLIGERIELIWKPGRNLWRVHIDPSQIDQVLANLMVNARDAIADVGSVAIETRNVTLDEADRERLPDVEEGDYVMLSVKDDGMGMDSDVMEQIFEPFFTTKAYGLGTGLGLATVYGIVRQNSGAIDVVSSPGEGARFSIYLPRHAMEHESPEPVEPRPAMQTGTETILLVEDEESLLSLGQRLLERLGYTVLATSRPEDALRMAREYDGEIHLLLTDVVMPQMNGRDLWRQVVAVRPVIRALFMSGYTADAIVHHGVLDEDVTFIQKPYTAASLGRKIRDVLDA